MNNPQGETDNRRLLLAVVLSGVVLLLWNYVFPAPPPVKAPPVDAPKAGAVEGPPAAAAPATPAAPVIERAVIAQIEEKDHHRVDFTNDDGQIAAWALTEPQYENTHADGSKSPFRFVGPVDGLIAAATATADGRASEDESDKTGIFEPPLLTLSLGGQPARGAYTVVEQGPRALTLGWTDPATGVEVTRHYRLDERGYTLSTDLRLENPAGRPIPYDLTAVFRGVQNDKEATGSMFMPPVYLFETVCKYGDDFERMPAAEIHERAEDGDPLSFTGVRWAGVDNRYFMTALLAEEGTLEACTSAADREGLPPRFTRLTSTIDLVGGEIPPGGQITRTFTFYAGPKKLSELQSTTPPTSDAIDFGVWSALCVPMLWVMRFFHGWSGNWGVAIILLTILVKLITLPLTIKQYKSMAGMKKVQPKMKALQEKHKDDKVKLQQEMMALYREHKINPLAGCLPMLLMMPIYFALYRTIYSAVELYRADFMLWLTDLSSQDPYYVTPLLLGVLMMIQMKLNPSAAEQMQQKIIMYVMPVVFTAMMLFLPSGLVIYILVNTVLGIAQQVYMLKQQQDEPTPAPARAR
ncbi:MAG: membrane protein insertase YidC [bacterium]